MVDYRRNYIQHDNALNIGEVDVDVVTEIRLADRAGFEANRQGLTDPDVVAMVGEDKAQLLVFGDLLYVVVHEYPGAAPSRESCAPAFLTAADQPAIDWDLRAGNIAAAA